MGCRFRIGRWLAASILAAIGSAGCLAPRVEIVLDETPAAWFGHKPTWGWGAVEAPWIEAPAGEIESYATDLTDAVARALERHGFSYSETQPDVCVRYRLVVRRTRIITRKAAPRQTITGSLMRGHYEVQSVRRVEREIDDVVLEIRVVRAEDGRPIWIARLRERMRDRFQRHLQRAVTRLFERFPRAPFHSAEMPALLRG